MGIQAKLFERMRLTNPLAGGSIRRKLSILTILNSSLALVLAGAGLLAYETMEERRVASQERIVQASIVAQNSLAPLSFSDESAAAENLAALEADSRILQAAIYDRSNRLFARYDRPGTKPTGDPPRAPRGAGVYFESGYLLAFEPIRLHGQWLGTVVLKAGMDDMEARIAGYVTILSVVLIFSLAISLLLSWGMQRVIVRPIAALSDAARHVSAERDFSVRVERESSGEVGLLIRAFNEMLARIESQDLARRAAEESMRESEERFALAVRGANDGLWDWKLSTNQIYFSPRWLQMLGYPPDENWSDPREWFSRIFPGDRDRVLAEIAAHRAGESPEFISEYRMRHSNGSLLWMLSRGIAVRSTDGSALRFAGSQSDITGRKMADPLTGFPNRLYFLDRLEIALDNQRRRGEMFAVLFLDLDRFKLVNDSLGNACGDALLVEIAQRIRACVSDPSGEAKSPHVVARLGGDEFAILLNGLTEPAAAAAVAQRILNDLAAPFRIQGRQIFTNASIGIAPGNSAKTPEELLRNADTAMFQAKTRGRARLEVFDEDMRERAIARLEMETELRRAIEEEQLVLYYQPQVSLARRRVTGCEALVRWNHPQRGMVPPDEFISLAEETDLIVPLGRWVLKEACRQMGIWQREQTSRAPLTISVNVSFKQLIDPHLLDDATRIPREMGLHPGSLRLELTESSVMTNAAEAIETMKRLKEIDIGLEIDDFGTGYSSLSYLKRLPFDTLKVDRSFVRELGQKDHSPEIVKTILDLSRSLNMTVVAEGVETEEHVAVLTSLGCSNAQGYYFSKPVPAGEAMSAIHWIESSVWAQSPGPDGHALVESELVCS